MSSGRTIKKTVHKVRADDLGSLLHCRAFIKGFGGVNGIIVGVNCESVACGRNKVTADNIEVTIRVYSEDIGIVGDDWRDMYSRLDQLYIMSSIDITGEDND